MDNKKDNLVKDLASVMTHITDPSYEKASKKAIVICFALKFVIAVAGCMLLRHVNEALADLFMLLVLAYSLYGHELYISMKIKENIVQNVINENLKKEDDNGEENKKDIECKESIEN